MRPFWFDNRDDARLFWHAAIRQFSVGDTFATQIKRTNKRNKHDPFVLWVTLEESHPFSVHPPLGVNGDTRHNKIHKLLECLNRNTAKGGKA